MAELTVTADVQYLGSKKIDHITNFLAPTDEGFGRYMVAAAHGFARYIRQNYLSGQRLRYGPPKPGKRHLRDTVKGVPVSGGRAAVQAGGSDVPYARAHELGAHFPVSVRTYYRGDTEVAGHVRQMNITAVHYLRDGVRNGDKYAKREADKVINRLAKQVGN